MQNPHGPLYTSIVLPLNKVHVKSVPKEKKVNVKVNVLYEMKQK